MNGFTTPPPSPTKTPTGSPSLASPLKASPLRGSPRGVKGRRFKNSPTKWPSPTYGQHTPPSKMGRPPRKRRGRKLFRGPWFENVRTVFQQRWSASCVVATLRNACRALHILNSRRESLIKKWENEVGDGACSMSRDMPGFAKKLGLHLEPKDDISTLGHLPEDVWVLLSIIDATPGGVESHALLVRRTGVTSVDVHDSQSGWAINLTEPCDIHLFEAWLNGRVTPTCKQVDPTKGWVVSVAE